MCLDEVTRNKDIGETSSMNLKDQHGRRIPSHPQKHGRIQEPCYTKWPHLLWERRFVKPIKNDQEKSRGHMTTTSSPNKQKRKCRTPGLNKLVLSQRKAHEYHE